MLLVFGDIDPTATAAGVASAAVNVFALYVAFRKRRVVDRKEDLSIKEKSNEVDEAAETNAINQWRAYIKARETQHRADLEDLRNQLNEYRKEVEALRKDEKRYIDTIARLESKNDRMQNEINQLKTIVERRKIPRPDGAPTSKSLPKIELPIVDDHPEGKFEDDEDQPQ